MNSVMRIATAVVLGLVVGVGTAFAGTGTLNVTPGTGAVMKEITDGSGNFGPTVGLCDGTALANCAAVKAASTAPVATDPAAVVGISPNTPALPGMGVGATGSAPPANALYNGANASGNLTGLISCDKSAIYDASTTGSTQMVAISGSTTIYICGYSIFVGGTATNVKFVYGTGSNCATSPANITPAYQLVANTGIVDGSLFFRGLKTIASQALCINASGANAVQAIVYYTQF